MTDLKRFEYVLALSECMNFSQAASKLGISQSTLSQYIQKLEKDLGVSLFERTTANLRLTQYGEIYLKSAREILDIYSTTLDTLSDADKGATGVVRMGISPSRAPFLLAGLTEEFKKEYPNVKLYFSESKTVNIIKKLYEGSVDFAVTVDDSLEKNSDFICEAVATESIMLVGAKEKKLCSLLQNGEFDFTKAKDMPFILLGDDQLLTGEFYRLSKKCSVSPEVAVQVSELSTAIALVKKGLGLTLLPSSYKQYGNLGDELDFLSIEQAKLRRKVVVAYRKDKYLNKPSKALISLIKSK